MNYATQKTLYIIIVITKHIEFTKNRVCLKIFRTGHNNLFKKSKTDCAYKIIIHKNIQILQKFVKIKQRYIKILSFF